MQPEQSLEPVISSPTKYRPFNRAVKVLLISHIITYVVAAMIGPIYAIYVERIGGTLLDASIASALYAVIGGVFVLISGRFSDKLKESEYLIILGYLIKAAGFIGYILATDIYHIFAAQIIFAIGDSIYSPPFNTIFARHAEGSSAGLHWGAWDSTYYIATFLGAIIGGYIVTLFSFEVLFTVMAVLCLLNGVYILIQPRKLL